MFPAVRNRTKRQTLQDYQMLLTQHLLYKFVCECIFFFSLFFLLTNEISEARRTDSVASNCCCCFHPLLLVLPPSVSVPPPPHRIPHSPSVASIHYDRGLCFKCCRQMKTFNLSLTERSRVVGTGKQSTTTKKMMDEFKSRLRIYLLENGS